MDYEVRFSRIFVYKRKRLQARLASLFLYSGLREFVEGECKLALLMSCGILMNDTASSSLVNTLNCNLVCLGSSSLITRLNSSIELLDDSLHLGASNLVLESLLLNNKNTLLCGLNVCQQIHLPIFMYPLRLRGYATNTSQLNIIPQIFPDCNRFQENILTFLKFFCEIYFCLIAAIRSGSGVTYAV